MRVLKRKKGKKDYYYLQYSYRSRGKIITKEKYLGKEIPKNINELKQSFFREEQGEIYGKFEQIKNHFQKEWKRIPASVRQQELEELSIAFTYNTNAIEGSTITLEEARTIIHDKVAPHKPLYDVKETEAHSKILLEMLEKKDKISQDLLLKWHQKVFGETKLGIAGKYRDYLVRVGSYVAPDWQDVSKLMSDLIRFISKSKLHSVELAARAHFKFESVHPFGDGNGRIGRLLMNYILWHTGYPMLIIEYKKRNSYYKALQRGEEGFMAYFFRRYLAVHEKRIK